MIIERFGKNQPLLSCTSLRLSAHSGYYQQAINHLTIAGDDLGYRAPKTRLVLDK